MSREKGMKIVVVEPRLSGCAAKADEWVPVRPGKDVVMLLAMARTMIEAGAIDEEFLTNYTNAPDLVGDDGKVLKSADAKASLVWDTVSGTAKPFTADVKPALKGSYAVEGKTYRTAFQVFADSVKDITPQNAEEICGVPAATIVRLAQTFAKEARIGETIVIDGETLRYRPAVLYTFRG
jgi:anaerobic selenocysteine-containing dehydrogenase